ncbi:MAG: OB-fold domain-containing protein, partial [Actinomycetota bacterium]|nr:OB-fold domain-containing protein [Actinomycetota bacterium]
MTAVRPLSAPIELSFNYTRSLGSTLGRFMTGLAERRIFGVRVADGRVFVPPVEYDPVTSAPVSDFIEVGDEGVVISWAWAPDPLEGQPFTRPFAWALVRLDGADTCVLHAVDAEHDEMRTGMRVRVRWAAEPAGQIRDIACFEPATGSRPPATESRAVDAVEIVTTPVTLRVQHSAS